MPDTASRGVVRTPVFTGACRWSRRSCAAATPYRCGTGCGGVALRWRSACGGVSCCSRGALRQGRQALQCCDKVCWRAARRGSTGLLAAERLWAIKCATPYVYCCCLLRSTHFDFLALAGAGGLSSGASVLPRALLRGRLGQETEMINLNALQGQPMATSLAHPLGRSHYLQRIRPSRARFVSRRRRPDSGMFSPRNRYSLKIYDYCHCTWRLEQPVLMAGRHLGVHARPSVKSLTGSRSGEAAAPLLTYERPSGAWAESESY